MIVDTKDFFSSVMEILNDQDVTFKIKGTSMWPFFKDGKTNITLTKPTQIRKLEVYLFKYKESFFLHRLIGIQRGVYIFKGDGLTKKEYVKKEDIVGHVTAYETKRVISVTKCSYKLRVRLYRILPRKLIIKVFK